MAIPISASMRVTGAQSRRMRRPQHQYQIRQKPWQIQPFFIAPVLPGETLQNLLIQSRVVSDPIKNGLVGWWCEKYVFYCKLRDLDARDTFTAMMLDPSTSMAALEEAADVDWYHSGNGPNYPKLCLKRIVEEYFRDEGEAWDTWKIGDLPLANCQVSESVFNSAMLESSYVTDDVTISTAGDNAFAMSELDTAFMQWELLRSQTLTNQSFEDFLQTYGVRLPQVELHKPELIRYVRDWTYPTNHVNPANGTPSSAVVWSIAERADKQRFFTEPGFLVGVCVVRPKVYRGGQKGHASSLLDSVYSWLPATLAGITEASWKKVAVDANSIIPAAATAWRVDTRDLFLYGDQFVNFALTETNANFVTLPNANLAKKYALEADADALFSAAAPANQIRYDGVVSMQILGTQSDLTPRTNR